MLASPHTAPKLMQLSQAELLGFHYHHRCGVGDIHAYLYDGGGDQHIQFAAAELLHDSLFLFWLEAAVEQADGAVGKFALAEPGVSGDDACFCSAGTSSAGAAARRAALHQLPFGHFDGFGGVNGRTHHIGLATCGNLVFDCLPHVFGFCALPLCDYRRASRGELV